MFEKDLLRRTKMEQKKYMVKETIVRLCKLLFTLPVAVFIQLLHKRDEYRVAAGKDPFLPH